MSHKSRKATSVSRGNVQTRTELGLKRRFSESHHQKRSVAPRAAGSLADALGLERDRAYDVLAATPLAAQAQRRRQSIERGDYSRRFRLELARKDAALIAEAAKFFGVELRITDAIRTWLVDADRAGFGDHDCAAVLARILSQRDSSKLEGDLSVGGSHQTSCEAR